MGFSGVSVMQLLVLIVLAAITVVPFWKIYGKAGFPPWIALLMLVPLVNVVVLFVVAFSPWPALSRRHG